MTPKHDFKEFLEKMEKELPSSIVTKEGKTYSFKELLCKAYIFGSSESKLLLNNQINQTLNALFDPNSVVSITSYEEMKSYWIF